MREILAQSHERFVHILSVRGNQPTGQERNQPNRQIGLVLEHGRAVPGACLDGQFRFPEC